MRSARTWRRRRLREELQEFVGGADRYVDMGALLCVVEQDVDHGEQLIPGKPPLRIVDRIPLGGMVDTRARPPQYVGPSQAPVVWYCSRAQARIVLGGDGMRSRQLVFGAAGAGKTELLALWVLVRVLMSVGIVGEIGCTAPSFQRTAMTEAALKSRMPASWYSYRERDKCFRLATGHTLRLLSTHQQSEAAGTPISSWTWMACASDELQDSVEQDAHIEMRGRGFETYPRLGTATVNDKTEWRNWLDLAEASGEWDTTRVVGTENPFTWAEEWARKARTMSSRLHAQLVLAQDVGVERQTYHAWSHAVNVRPRPLVGGRDVTSIVLRRKTANPQHALLGGHDPGELQNVTIFLKAYELPGEVDPVWWVVGELTTKRTTTEEHGLALLKTVRTRWGCNVRAGAEIVHVRCDPYGKSEKKPDKDSFRVFDRLEIDIKAAEYSKDGTGTGQIKVDARIEMVNRLLCDATGRTRLYIDCDDQRQPVAPLLVKALEQSQRDELGRAEQEKKDKNDQSHWPAALAMALWPWEKEAAKTLRADVRAAVRRG